MISSLSHQFLDIFVFSYDASWSKDDWSASLYLIASWCIFIILGSKLIFNVCFVSYRKSWLIICPFARLPRISQFQSTFYVNFLLRDWQTSHILPISIISPQIYVRGGMVTNSQGRHFPLYLEPKPRCSFIQQKFTMLLS